MDSSPWPKGICHPPAAPAVLGGPCWGPQPCSACPIPGQGESGGRGEGSAPNLPGQPQESVCSRLGLGAPSPPAEAGVGRENKGRTCLRSQQAFIRLGQPIPLPCPAHEPLCCWKCSLCRCVRLSAPWSPHQVQMDVGSRQKILLSGSACAGAFPWSFSLDCAT